MKYFILNHKCFLALVVFLMIKYNLLGQQNLVPNPSFEQYSNCPINNSVSNTLASKPNIWYKPDKRGAVYFNSCTNNYPTDGVPYNTVFGQSYQFAKSGVAYMAMGYINFGYADYIQVKLLDSLHKNKKYYSEHYVSLFNPSNFGCNNIGMLFTNNVVYADTINKSLLLANPQILSYGNPIVTDTMGWVKISGIFSAQGGEQFLTLGNFKSKANTQTKIIQTNAYDGAGYYVDDVAVYNLDSFKLNADAGKDTTITIGDSVFIGSYTNGIDTIKWQNQNTNAVINTTAPGFWVKPTINTCYSLTQTVNGYTSSDSVCVIVKPLPLNFISFTIFPFFEGVRGSFTTASEINVSHYNIQRSTNGKDFTTIGTIKANNKNYNEYNFKDNQPLFSNSYYRIQSIDKDSKASYTDTKKITINDKQQTINVYPNPATTTLNIASQQNIQQIKLINQLGQTLKQLTNLNTKQQNINIKYFAKGVYIIQITTTNQEVKTQKIIIE